MCGIVGYVGSKNALPVLIKGLEHLEYRGYDSAGIACFQGEHGKIRVVKEKGKIAKLKATLDPLKLESAVGIGHTRWATHGIPSRENAHPHMDYKKRLFLVHNGIIENYAELKKELNRKGAKFSSQTDTEVAANLIASFNSKQNLLAAMQKAVKKMKGYYAFVAMSPGSQDEIVVFKRSNPIVIGLGKGENFVASDVSALLPYTRQVLYLEDDEFAVIKRNQVQIFTLDGKLVKRSPMAIRWDVGQAQKGGHPHFMLKEIYEQPEVVKNILDSRIRKETIFLDTVTPKIKQRLKKIEKIHFVSCGTAYHAGLVGNYMIGECLWLPAEATVSSEFRYEDPAVNEKDLVVLVTQSGETADTLAAMREAKKKGALTLAIVNVVGSTIAREADCVLYTHAGPEIGVASTKAYMAQLMAIALFSLYLGQIHPYRKKDFNKAKQKRLLKEFRQLPKKILQALKQETVISKCAKALFQKKSFLYLGRGYSYPNALEGALKLKEITYAHAHGYPAGEMKHGPIALIDSAQPVICICLKTSKTYEKMISNIEEIKARKGIIISIATKGDQKISALSKYVFNTPSTEDMLSPILSVIPLQLFAYKVAIFNGRNVDQPRNLAKSVTVE